jgi:formylglycine-generating enzyme required for sulfatase activity
MPTSATPSPKLIYKRQEKTAKFFNEPLPEGLALKMMLIPGGAFSMGSPPEELHSIFNQGPQHQVSIPEFCLGKYLVTQAQWRVVAALPQVNQPLVDNPSEFEGDLYPVEQISWLDAVEFCDRLSVYTKRQYRLPSEAEWEYACRAGTITPFSFGETITTDLSNYNGVDSGGYLGWSGFYGDGPNGVYRQTTTPVDSFPPNAFGLCDMHGNVWEWCADHWHRNYEGAPTDGSAWLNESNDRLRRGGSWGDTPRDCRSAYRHYNGQRARANFIGFRVVCSTPKIIL